MLSSDCRLSSWYVSGADHMNGLSALLRSGLARVKTLPQFSAVTANNPECAGGARRTDRGRGWRGRSKKGFDRKGPHRSRTRIQSIKVEGYKSIGRCFWWRSVRGSERTADTELITLAFAQAEMHNLHSKRGPAYEHTK